MITSRTGLTNIVQPIKVLLIGLLLSLSAAASAAETITFIHTDVYNSPVAASDASGVVIWREDYQPYGKKIKKEPGAASQTVWYTGKPQDPDSGLVYMGARHYNPQLGRFISVDPVAFQEENVHSFNRYAYGNNNPYKYVDPDGETPIEIFTEVLPAAGDAFGALAAYGVGMATGNQAFINEAIAGMRGNSGDGALAIAAVFAPTGASKVFRATKSVAKEPNRIYSARELKRRAEKPRTNNAANPNHNFPESFNAEIFKGNKTIVSDKYHLYTKPGTLNGRSGVYEIGVKPSASGRTEVITHRFFNPSKK